MLYLNRWIQLPRGTFITKAIKLIAMHGIGWWGGFCSFYLFVGITLTAQCFIEIYHTSSSYHPCQPERMQNLKSHAGVAPQQ